MTPVVLGSLVVLVTGEALPTTMKAAKVLKRTSDLSRLTTYIQEVDAPVPTPQAGQVLVAVGGASVNPCDWKLALRSNPKVLGRDVAGEVVAVGKSVTGFKVGDAVWADNLQKEGTLAEYAVLDESVLGLAPKGLATAEAAVLPLVATTGLQALDFAQGPWQPSEGKTVVILGGSGGTGHVGIQLAKAYGATKIIATCGTSHVSFCKELGADEVIDYHEQDWLDVVEDRSVHLVYDCVAQDHTGDTAYAKIRDGGFYVPLLPGAEASAAVARSRPKVAQTWFAVDHHNITRLNVARDLVEAGKLRANVDKSFALRDVAQAFDYIMAGHTTGKISVVPDSAVLV